MPRRIADIAWTTNEGRNGFDAPQNIPSDMSQESLNLHLEAGTLGAKRKAISGMIFSPWDLGPNRFIGVNAMTRFAPSQFKFMTQLVFVTNNTPVIRMFASIAAPTTTRELVLADPIVPYADLGEPWNTTFAALNGKLFIAYYSGVNRLHVLDIGNVGTGNTEVRRTGLKAPLQVASVVDTGVGTYAAITRFYAVINRHKIGPTVIRQSNIGNPYYFNPSATGLAARVTRAAPTSDGETHWVLHGSLSPSGPWYPLAELPIATTFYDDTQDPNTYSANGPAAPPFGSHYPMPSLKYLTTDGARLLGLGVWETVAGDSVRPQNGTVYVSPVIESSFGSGTGQDEERFQSTADQVDTIVLNLNADAVDIGISPVLNNTIYAFQSRGIWALTPTQNSQVPYAKHQIDKHRGAVSHQSIILGADAQGRPCIYFLNPNDGPNRIVLGGSIEWLGKDLEDIWPTVNQNAGYVIAHGVYDTGSKEVKWFVSGPSADEPNMILVYNVTLGRTEVRDQGVRYGWGRWTGMIAEARCSCMLEPFPDAHVLPFIDNLHVGRITEPYIARQDGVFNSDNNTTPYQAYARSGSLWRFAARGFRRLYDAYLTARSAVGVMMRQTIVRNYGQDNPTADVSIAPAATETRVIRRVGDTNIAECNIAQVQVGDSAAVANRWLLDRWDASTEETMLDQPNP